MLANQKGSAVIEMIPIIIIIAVLVNYSIGFFGVIHTGILNSMAARNYAFETFQHRSSLRYFREKPGDDKLEFSDIGNRVHGVISEKKMSDSTNTEFSATSRRITMGPFSAPKEAGNDEDTHKSENTERGVAGIETGKRNTSVSVAPVWIKSTYGICLTYNCEREQLQK